MCIRDRAVGALGAFAFLQILLSVLQTLQLVLFLCKLRLSSFLFGSEPVSYTHLLLLLFHQDIILLFQILPPTVGRLLIQMQPMPSGDVKQERPADRIKGLLAVVVPAFGLLRVWERDAQFFQRLFLLGAQLPVAVLTVKDLSLIHI